jgi:hypothetical protein
MQVHTPDLHFSHPLVDGSVLLEALALLEALSSACEHPLRIKCK